MTYVVCGWYTPDYNHLADRLIGSLNAVGAEHDIVAVPAAEGGWERQTMRKPAQVLAAMERHPGKTIAFVDVDCEAVCPLGEIEDIRGDVAFHFRAGITGKGPTRFFGRTSLMVLRPTPAARRMVEAWIAIGKSASRGTVDQNTLPMAIALTPHILVEHLPARFCAHHVDQERAPLFKHSNASRKARKIPKWLRYFYHQVSAHRVRNALRNRPMVIYWLNRLVGRSEKEANLAVSASMSDALYGDEAHPPNCRTKRDDYNIPIRR